MKNRVDIQLPPERYEYYRTRFLADLAREKPPFFIDAVHEGPYFGQPDQRDRSRFGHETLPGLGDYIRENYVPWFEFGEKGNGIRAYLSRERYSELQSGASAN